MHTRERCLFLVLVLLVLCFVNVAGTNRVELFSPHVTCYNPSVHPEAAYDVPLGQCVIFTGRGFSAIFDCSSSTNKFTMTTFNDSSCVGQPSTVSSSYLMFGCIDKPKLRFPPFCCCAPRREVKHLAQNV